MSAEKKTQTFETLTLSYLEPLYSYAVALTGNKEEAQDLVQETYLKAFRAFESFKEGTNLKAWLFRILKNTFINEYYDKKRFEELNGDTSADEAYEKLVMSGKVEAKDAGIDRDVFGHLMGDEVNQAMESLPPLFRSAVYLADVEELTYEEIADVLEVPVGTVRSRIARGRKMLQVKLRKYAVESGYIRSEE